MRQRIAALGGVGIVAALGLAILWGGSFAKPVSAMEKMAEELRKVKSYKCMTTMQFKRDLTEPGDPPVVEPTWTTYWLTPGYVRIDSVNAADWHGPGPQSTRIVPPRQPAIDIDHKSKTFQRLPAATSIALSGPLDDLEHLGELANKPHRELGTQVINGKQASGFEIDRAKAFPGSMPGTIQVWLAADSKLPVVVRYEQQARGYHTTQLISDIQWNINLDPKLFDVIPPQGYADKTEKPMALEEQVRRIVEGLRVYSDVNGGRYPPRNGMLGAHFDELLAKLGLARMPIGDAKEGNAVKARKAFDGFNEILNVFAYRPDAVYNGKTVKQADKDKVLLRWKLDDGRYAVIFGDLRSETVTSERLRALEGGR